MSVMGIDREKKCKINRFTGHYNIESLASNMSPDAILHNSVSDIIGHLVFC